eukprot:scaffold3122_cov136-Isochrysis_galbana.AAC.6
MRGEAGAAWARAGCASPNDARPLHPQGEGFAELCRGDAPPAPDYLPRATQWVGLACGLRAAYRHITWGCGMHP